MFSQENKDTLFFLLRVFFPTSKTSDLSKQDIHTNKKTRNEEKTRNKKVTVDEARD